ncbi:MAG: Endonuclease III [Clostridium sp.]|jgi:hypothetical protein
MKLLFVILKCFLILVLFGLFLPKFMDYVLYYFIIKPHVYQNSLFVYNVFNKDLTIIYNYIIVVREFLKF